MASREELQLAAAVERAQRCGINLVGLMVAYDVPPQELVSSVIIPVMRARREYSDAALAATKTLAALSGDDEWKRIPTARKTTYAELVSQLIKDKPLPQVEHASGRAAVDA